MYLLIHGLDEKEIWQQSSKSGQCNDVQCTMGRIYEMQLLMGEMECTKQQK